MLVIEKNKSKSSFAIRRIQIAGKYLLFVLMLWLMAIPITGQIDFRHLTTQDGLSSNIVSCFLRDSRGFLWIGTLNGLNRYDGYTFTIYYNDPNNQKSIKGNWVVDIVEDKEGIIWIATANRTLNRYDYVSDKFKSYDLSNDSTSNSSGLLVKDLFIDKDNNLWIAVLNEGLFKYIRSTDSFIAFRTEKTENSISSNLVSSITQDSKGQIWILTNNGILNKFNPASDSFEKIRYSDQFTGNPMDVYSGKLYADSRDRIWIGTQNMGFYIYDTNKNTFQHFMRKENRNSLCNNTVTGIVELNENQFWVSTDHGGLDLFDLKKVYFTHYTHNPNDLFSLSNDQIYTIYKDYENIYWFGNYMGGVNYFKYSKNYFDNYGFSDDGKGLSNGSVLCLLERSNGEIWIGTDGGGINILQPQKDNSYVLINNPPINNKINSKIIASLLEDSKGRIWIGTYQEGLNRFDPKTQEIKEYLSGDESQTPISHASVWYIFEDSKKRLWVGTLGSGLLLYNEMYDSFFQFPYNKKGVSGTSGSAIFYINEDHKNRIWIISAGSGLDLFNEKDSSFTSFSSIPGDTNSLISQGVVCINEDSHSRLWIGTLEGLELLDTEKKTFQHLNKRNGLPNNAIQGILEDEKGNLWISTFNGLCKYNPEQKTTKNFFKRDGLHDSYFNYKACLKTRKGKMFFGSQNGITSFYPNSLEISDAFPPVVITDLKLFNKSLKIGDDSPLKQNILCAKEIILDYNQNFISFNYAAIQYLGNDNISYSYYMEGLEDKWNHVGSLRTASYTNLKPGKYVFHVQATSDSGTSTSTSTSLKIIIRPPFWQTWWFILLTIITLLLSLYLIYLFRLSNLKKQKLQLEKMVSEKTIELSVKNRQLSEQANELNETNVLLEERSNMIEEQTEKLRFQRDELSIRAEELAEINIKLEESNRIKDRFFSIIAHDLKNPFTTIIGFSELLKLKKDTLTDEKRDLFIDAIYNSSVNVYNLLENILLWSISQSDRIKYEPEKIRIKGVIEANILLQRENIREKKLKVEENVSEDLMFYADSNMLDTVLRNLLSNAIKFTPDKGSIKISCTHEDGKSLFCITDSGMGIPEESIHQLFRIDKTISTSGTKGEKGTGLGLILCKEFIDRHKGEIAVESVVGQGSTFTIALPFPDKVNS